MPCESFGGFGAQIISHKDTKNTKFIQIFVFFVSLWETFVAGNIYNLFILCFLINMFS